MSQMALFIGGPWDGKRRALSPQEEDRSVIQVAAPRPVPVYSPDAMDDRQMLLTLFDGYRRPAKEEGEE